MKVEKCQRQKWLVAWSRVVSWGRLVVCQYRHWHYFSSLHRQIQSTEIQNYSAVSRNHYLMEAVLPVLGLLRSRNLNWGLGKHQDSIGNFSFRRWKEKRHRFYPRSLFKNSLSVLICRTLPRRNEVMLTNTELRDLNLKFSLRVLHQKFINIHQDSVCSNLPCILFFQFSSLITYR